MALKLDIDRIRRLAAEGGEDIPPITEQQAEAVARLLLGGTPKPAEEPS